MHDFRPHGAQGKAGRCEKSLAVLSLALPASYLMKVMARQLSARNY